MNIVDPVVFVPFSEISKDKLLKMERYGRVCYKSEDKISENSSSAFLKNIINGGHESVIEHEKATVLIVADRGISHEIVRHRIASYSQESTRYCNYSKEKFGKEITVIRPFFYKKDNNKLKLWEDLCRDAETTYFRLLNDGYPQEARSILPNSLKTELVVTFNFREWRHFFRLRCTSYAHPQMRQIAIPLLLKFKENLPALFEDISYDIDFPSEHYAKIILSNEYFEIEK
jgi:thymidylate synthase (FAD)